jgi:hypothetical protein
MTPAMQGSDDPIYRGFMERQLEEGMALAAASDLLRLHVPLSAPPHLVAEFLCKGLVRERDGVIKEAENWRVGIWFPPHYLRRIGQFDVLRMFTPNAWHPNISRELPLICIGHIVPGMTLVDILYQTFEVLSYHKFNPREDDCLNPVACAWAREHQHLFPIDRRPLKRRKLHLEVHPV